MAAENAAQSQDFRAIRGGYLIFILCMVIPWVVLASVRFVLTGTAVSPNYDQAIGAVLTVVSLLSAYLAHKAITAAKSGDQVGAVRNLGRAAFLGLVTILGILYGWTAVNLAPGSRPGEIYFVLTGFVLLFTLVGVLILQAARTRIGRVGITAENHWDVDSASWFWYIASGAWVAMWLILYIL